MDLEDWATHEVLHAPDHVSHNDGFKPWIEPVESWQAAFTQRLEQWRATNLAGLRLDGAPTEPLAA